jgi:hypothetical protein
MAQRGFVDERVAGVIADLGERQIEFGWIETALFIGEDFDIHQLAESFGQGGGVIGNAAGGRRHR